jgi:hypothetical protein
LLVYVTDGKQKTYPRRRLKCQRTQFVNPCELPKFNESRLIDYISFNNKQHIESNGDVKEQEMDFITFFESKNKLQLEVQLSTYMPHRTKAQPVSTS